MSARHLAAVAPAVALLASANCAHAQEADSQWRAGAPVPQARTEVSATTDGRAVYLIGGFAAPLREGERPPAPRDMYAYDPQADRWQTVGQIPEGVNHAGFAYLEGRLYIVGGYRANSFDPVDAVRIYDIATGEWSDGAPMPTARGALAVAVHDGRIHAIGGTVADRAHVHEHDNPAAGQDRSVGTHEVYDPRTNSWERRAAMPTARNHHGAATVDGRIHVLAGRVSGDMELTTHEIYDPATDSWSNGPPLPTGRSGVAVVEARGRVFVFGGETFVGRPRTYDDAEAFDPAAGEWERLPPMPTARHGLGAAAIDGTIYVVSGGPGPGFAFGTSNERLELRGGAAP